MINLKYRQEARDLIVNDSYLVLTDRWERFITTNPDDPMTFIFLPKSLNIDVVDYTIYDTKELMIEDWDTGEFRSCRCYVFDPINVRIDYSCLVWIGNNNRGMWAFYNNKLK